LTVLSLSVLSDVLGAIMVSMTTALK